MAQSPRQSPGVHSDRRILQLQSDETHQAQSVGRGRYTRSQPVVEGHRRDIRSLADRVGEVHSDGRLGETWVVGQRQIVRRNRADGSLIDQVGDHLSRRDAPLGGVGPLQDLIQKVHHAWTTLVSGPGRGVDDQLQPLQLRQKE